MVADPGAKEILLSLSFNGPVEALIWRNSLKFKSSDMNMEATSKDLPPNNSPLSSDIERTLLWSKSIYESAQFCREASCCLTPYLRMRAKVWIDLFSNTHNNQTMKQDFIHISPELFLGEHGVAYLPSWECYSKGKCFPRNAPISTNAVAGGKHVMNLGQ